MDQRVSCLFFCGCSLETCRLTFVGQDLIVCGAHFLSYLWLLSAIRWVITSSSCRRLLWSMPLKAIVKLL